MRSTERHSSCSIFPPNTVGSDQNNEDSRASLGDVLAMLAYLLTRPIYRPLCGLNVQGS